MADALSQAHSLAGVMEEAGPSCSTTETRFQDILKHLSAPTETAVAEVFGMLARTSEGDGDSSRWNVSVIVEGLKAANPALDWSRVAEHLDHPRFSIPNAAAFQVFMAAWRHASVSPFPLHAIVSGLWSNTAGQLSFLQQAAAAPPDVFSWDHAARKQEPLEGLHAGKLPTGTSNQCWMCLDLYATLAALSDSGHAAAVRAVLDVPLKQCPEVLLLGIASVKGGWGPLQHEVCDALLLSYVTSHPNSPVVLPRLWPLNPDALLKALVALYNKDPTNISRALDICRELKALPAVLDATPTPFCTELAALASRREYLNLEKWLADQFHTRGVSFMQATVAFLDSKLRDDTLQSSQASVYSMLSILCFLIR
jgi:CCR4-NOT transcription complex subunit 1